MRVALGQRLDLYLQPLLLQDLILHILLQIQDLLAVVLILDSFLLLELAELDLHLDQLLALPLLPLVNKER